jgi:hypothetical protein
MQKKKHHRLRRTLLIILAVIIIVVGLIIAFISPITKYLVEKYDTEYLGREVTMNWAYVNPFTGYLHFDDLQIMEQKNDTTFLSTSGISVNFEMMKMLSGTYEISALTISDLRALVIHGKDDIFNFTDIVEKFTKEEEPKEEKEPVHFNILDVEIKNGEIIYDETFTPVKYSVNKLNVEWSGKYWNADTMNVKYEFSSGTGSGDFKGKMFLNTATSDYTMEALVKKFDLTAIDQYMQDMMNYGKLRAFLDADVKAKGNLKDARNVDAKGIIALSDFHFGKDSLNDFASFEKFVVDIIKINPKGEIYEMDSISLSKPYFKFEKYDELDNIQNMFGKGGENVKNAAATKDEQFNLVLEIADYVKLLAKNFFHSDYKIGRLAIYSADIRYVDYSMSEKLAVSLDPLSVLADSLNSNKDKVYVKLYSGIKPYGTMNIKIGINPKDSSDFDLNFNIEKINATVLNPILITQTTYPLDRGSIAVRGDWRVRNGKIDSKNHILVIDPRITKRVRMDDNTWLPLKVAMFFVRERGNAIDYEVPITGDLKDPKFHLRDVILDVVKNIFVKPATPVYRSEIKTVELEIEKNLAMNWETSAEKLLPDQKRFAEDLSDFLKDNPNSAIIVTPVHFTEKEKEYILFFEAKKKYFLRTKNKKASEFTEKDSIEVFRMEVKDSVFRKYIESQIKNETLYTMQAKCEAYVGSDIVHKKFDAMNKKRMEVFKEFFKDENVVNRVKFKAAQQEIPFNGFSYYRIAYDGELPEDLKESFNKLREYDEKKPREKLKEERKKTRRWFKKGN